MRKLAAVPHLSASSHLTATPSSLILLSLSSISCSSGRMQKNRASSSSCCSSHGLLLQQRAPFLRKSRTNEKLSPFLSINISRVSPCLQGGDRQRER